MVQILPSSLTLALFYSKHRGKTLKVNDKNGYLGEVFKRQPFIMNRRQLPSLSISEIKIENTIIGKEREKNKDL